MAWAGNAHRTIYERKLVILRLYLSNFTSEHTAELGLGQGIRLLGWLGTKVSFVEIKAKVRSNLPRCWYLFVTLTRAEMTEMPLGSLMLLRFRWILGNTSHVTLWVRFNSNARTLMYT